eukprot:12397729-Karenia_brevis.AAC.1
MWESKGGGLGLQIQPLSQIKISDDTPFAVIDACQVVQDAEGIALVTRDTFKTIAGVRSQKPLAVLVPGHVYNNEIEDGITPSSISKFWIIMADPITRIQERQAVTMVNLGAKPFIENAPKRDDLVAVKKHTASSCPFSTLEKPYFARHLGSPC